MNLKIDSCSLILLQHLGIIPLVKETIGNLVITNEVYHESVVEGSKKQKAIADKLAIHCEQKLIQVVENQGRIPVKLGLGEAETLAESKFELENGEKVICITEDKKAKREAIHLQIPLLGVDSLLVELCIRGCLSEADFDKKIITLDKFHKLSLIRITELRRFIRYIKEKGEKN